MAGDPAEPSRLLRPRLLEGQVVAVATPAPADGVIATVQSACAELSARVVPLGWHAEGQEACDLSVASLLDREGALHTLVNDAAGAYRQKLTTGGEGAGPSRALRAALDGTWNVIRAAANAHFISGSGGKVITLAPAPGTGAGSESTAAGLENMTRTLSIEWARYRICTTAIVPGPSTPAAPIASVVAFLASPAGDYYSGCRFDLGGGRRADR